MGRIETLADVYKQHVELPWQRTIAGAQRILIVVYDKDLERTFRARKELFATATREAGHGWREVDATPLFARWLASEEYRDSFFETPSDISSKYESEFEPYVAEQLQTALHASDPDSVVAFTGVASLFGFASVSEVLKRVERDVRGRLVVFFPGSHENNNYRLLDARDGWNYLAPCISIHGTRTSA